MKTKRFCKSTVSMILALIMLVSMCTVAFINTAAAETDVAQTGAGTTVYFQNNWKWSEVSAYYWGTSADPSWPGNAMTLVGEVDGNEVYAIRIPEGVSGLIFNGKKDDGSGAIDQTPDILEGIVDGKGWKMDWINDANVAVEFIYNPDGCSHSADGEGTVIVAATCTTGGQVSHVCTCRNRNLKYVRILCGNEISPHIAGPYPSAHLGTVVPSRVKNYIYLIYRVSIRCNC